MLSGLSIVVAGGSTGIAKLGTELQKFGAVPFAIAWLSGCSASPLLLLPLRLENMYLLGKLHLWP